MIPNEKVKLLETWGNNPFAELSIAEIMKKSEKKSKTWAFNSLNSLIQKRLVLLRKHGNLNLYSLNIQNPLVTQALQYIEMHESLDFPHLDLIISAINKTPLKNYCLIVFGSYAENRQSKKSDLDICFLIENKAAEKRIRPYINETKMEFPQQVDEHYITFEDFIKMLTRSDENLGKQVFRKHKIFYNADIFYQLIKEAYRNGFRP